MGMLKDLDITPEDPAELKAVNRLLANEVKALSLKVEQLQHQLHGANRHRFGSKSEGLDQLRLDLQETPRSSRRQRRRPTRHPRQRMPGSRSASTAASLCRIIWIGKTKNCRLAMIAVGAVEPCVLWARM
jgi:hypothetical protein